MNGIRRALLLTSAERYLTLVANFVTLSVISRMLTPSEIGVSILGIAVVGFSRSVFEFAGPIYLIQKKEISANDVRSFVTLQVIFGLVICAVVVAAAPMIAAAYDAPGLTSYLQVVGIGILADAVSAPISALLRREMAFARLAAISIAGVIVNLVLAIGLAYLGYSFMSLAWASLGSMAAIAILSILLYRDVSIFRPRFQNWGEIFVFGGYYGGNQFLYRMYETLPSVLLGRMISINAVALYGRSVTICQLPEKFIMGGASVVLLPAFSAAFREGQDLRKAYLRAIEYIAAVQWPAFLLLFVLAHPVVEVVLGGQWLSIVPFVQVMALACLSAFSAELNHALLIATGGMRDVFIRSLIVWPLSASIIVISAFYGLYAVALSWLLIIPLQNYVAFFFVRKYISVDWADVGGAIKAASVVAVSSLVGPLAVVASAGTFEISVQAAALSIVVSAMGWFAALWLTKHPLKNDIIEVASPVIGVDLKKKVTKHA